MITNAMTIDVEDYFQVSAFEKHIDRNDWDNISCRVENSTNRVLDLLGNSNVKATFFVLGWVAERYPGLVKRIVSEGHELASHGLSHIRVTQQTREQFREDVISTKALLEDISGSEIKGYRAASYSINKSNLWALEVLAETGHIYSSSIYPIKHDLYGIPDAPRFKYNPIKNCDFIEVPVTTVEKFGKKMPCGGGGYFRLYPYSLSRWAIKQVNKVDRQSSVFYFHPWEIDPNQPRQKNIGGKTRFRHYLNLGKMENRLTRLLNDFSWGRMDEIFL